MAGVGDQLAALAVRTAFEGTEATTVRLGIDDHRPIGVEDSYSYYGLRVWGISAVPTVVAGWKGETLVDTQSLANIIMGDLKSPSVPDDDLAYPCQADVDSGASVPAEGDLRPQVDNAKAAAID